MKTFAEVENWCDGATERYGDPSKPICHLILRWEENLATYRGDELACGIFKGEFAVLLAPGDDPLPLHIEPDGPRIDNPIIDRVESVATCVLHAFGAELITTGVWTLVPSLNIEGVIHGIVTLHGVPSPAPWEQQTQILLLGARPRRPA